MKVTISAPVFEPVPDPGHVCISTCYFPSDYITIHPPKKSRLFHFEEVTNSNYNRVQLQTLSMLYTNESYLIHGELPHKQSLDSIYIRLELDKSVFLKKCK